MSNRFFCKNRNRLKIIIEKKILNGIDYLEVVSTDQRTLKVFFAFNLPGEPGTIPVTSPPLAPLTKDNIVVDGGVRIKNIKVENISTTGNVLKVKVDQAGDFSTYTLRVVNSSTTHDPPAGFDILLSSIDFSFKINCPTEFDCKSETNCPPENFDEPDIDYLAKDYSSFKRLMIDRMSTIMPNWKERNAADLQVALVELLAYVGDHLSYYQDAVATEAYLGTARRRISLKRHARLLDYFVHDGCNARAWVHIEVEKNGGADGANIKQGTALLTNDDKDQVMVSENEMIRLVNERGAVVFETMHDLKLFSEHNQISFYAWGNSDCCLPKGSTQATLIIDTALFLEPGDALVFEEIRDPSSGEQTEADPTHRHAVRLKSATTGEDELTGTKILNIEWDEEDALPFALCLTSTVDGKGHLEISVAHGNIVLADQGKTERSKELQLAEKKYLKLPQRNIISVAEYEHDLEKDRAAVLTLKQDVREALPYVTLKEGNETWIPRKDLLASDRFAAEFVVETGQNGLSYLRFGDDTLGKKPQSDTKFTATYRIGNGKAGNVGASAISTIVWKNEGITTVKNLLPATGGTDAETMEEVRQYAPQAFRTQQRAITESDYVEKTELHAEVQKAAAKFYWTGSWYTVYIIIDRKGGKDIDEEFKTDIRNHLEQYRMAGYDLEIRQPKLVPLSIILNVCVLTSYFRADIRQSLLKLFSNYELGDGTKGFFHPDNFTFGQPVYLSAIYEKAMTVQGVASVEIKEFKRWTKNANKEKEEGLLKVSELEIVRLDNDRNFPENGKIDFIMFGGL